MRGEEVSTNQEKNSKRKQHNHTNTTGMSTRHQATTTIASTGQFLQQVPHVFRASP